MDIYIDLSYVRPNTYIKMVYRDIIKTYKNIDEYKPGQSINAGVQLCSNEYVLVMSGHTQIINLNFKTVKDQLEKYKDYLGRLNNKISTSKKNSLGTNYNF